MSSCATDPASSPYTVNRVQTLFMQQNSTYQTKKAYSYWIENVLLPEFGEQKNWLLKDIPATSPNISGRESFQVRPDPAGKAGPGQVSWEVVTDRNFVNPIETLSC